jgi:deoxyribodipyrimidine photo-lyase
MNLFIFRRDFRLDDNLGLIKALDIDKVLPIFIFTPEQIVNNKFKSDNSLQFLIESLSDLDKQLSKYSSKLHIFFGDNIEVLNKINLQHKIDTIYCNQDFTPYAKKRDQAISKKFKLELVEDYLLHKMDTLLKKDRTIYKVFTPFYRFSKTFQVDNPLNITFKKDMFFKKSFEFEIKLSDIDQYYKKNKNLFVNGGRENALKRLSEINLTNYSNDRNIINKETSYLSGYIKYGCVSIREVYYDFKQKYSKDNPIFSQLYWREFYFYIIHHYPNVLKSAFNSKYSNIKWENNSKYFTAWKNGKTGFPVVDASIRQMNTTGYMTNRGRLIVSNFLIKILLIDWRKGEKYFSQKLIDYDPAVNNGNWQWVSGTGVDYQPLFRILNPWTQISKYDSNADFIKKWIPELKDVPVNDIIKWEEKHQDYKVYHKPIICYKDARQKGLNLYKN